MILKLSAMRLQCNTEASQICTHPLHTAPHATKWLLIFGVHAGAGDGIGFDQTSATASTTNAFLQMCSNGCEKADSNSPSLSFSSKGVELLVCDLLLTLRTSLWQRAGSSNGEPGPAPGTQLSGFQRDLSALRKLTQCYRQAQHKVLPGFTEPHLSD